MVEYSLVPWTEVFLFCHKLPMLRSAVVYSYLLPVFVILFLYQPDCHGNREGSFLDAVKGRAVAHTPPMSNSSVGTHWRYLIC